MYNWLSCHIHTCGTATYCLSLNITNIYIEFQYENVSYIYSRTEWELLVPRYELDFQAGRWETKRGKQPNQTEKQQKLRHRSYPAKYRKTAPFRYKGRKRSAYGRVLGGGTNLAPERVVLPSTYHCCSFVCTTAQRMNN